MMSAILAPQQPDNGRARKHNRQIDTYSTCIGCVFTLGINIFLVVALDGTELNWCLDVWFDGHNGQQPAQPAHIQIHLLVQPNRIRRPSTETKFQMKMLFVGRLCRAGVGEAGEVSFCLQIQIKFSVVEHTFSYFYFSLLFSVTRVHSLSRTEPPIDYSMRPQLVFSFF